VSSASRLTQMASTEMSARFVPRTTRVLTPATRPGRRAETDGGRTRSRGEFTLLAIPYQPHERAD
jgi:hypothetical protein